jgi:hypothetical protein
MNKITYFKFTEFALALLTMLWGVWLLMPWEVYSTSGVFTIMSDIVSENLAGAIMAISGGMWLFLAFSKNRLNIRRFLLLFIIFLWVIIDVVYILGNFASTATVVNSVIVVLITKAYIEILEELKAKSYGKTQS